MTHAHSDEDTFGEFAAELRALAEILLERVEPALRRAAADGREWDSCSWCPVCAAAALVRGEHHDVVAAVADHGTAIVTVLREALAGVPVEPLLPDDDADGTGDRNGAGGDPDAAAPESGPAASDPRTGESADGDGPRAGAPDVSDRDADPDRLRAKGSRHDAGDARHGDARHGGARRRSDDAAGPKAKRGGRGRHSAAERPGYIPIPVRIKK
ncbi:hypothetical protein NONO_c23370 [Nocardia nova SH22a]|uniref:Uncharacterized protein n=1 Tax=Nocardia nova SH22a TaxID=1415166 RepID=W5TDQ5_9NOCA|nr:hypothetical protein [Nocardia nova]AHH17133.1 hypothetical protein NONO_c23370 [Nocardia nova SH22a]